MPLNVFNGNGCFGPIAAGGASYADLAPGTSIRVWSGANCTGCSRTITADTNFCSASFDTGGAGCTGGLNDAVASVSIP
jgi:D-arabinose 1-dehydrogenase-like Zn-dependent alcohol dehydrogenase